MCYSHLMHIKHTEPAVLAHPPLTTTEVPLSKTLNTNYLSVQTVITPEIKCYRCFPSWSDQTGATDLCTFTQSSS